MRLRSVIDVIGCCPHRRASRFNPTLPTAKSPRSRGVAGSFGLQPLKKPPPFLMNKFYDILPG